MIERFDGVFDALRHKREKRQNFELLFEVGPITSGGLLLVAVGEKVGEGGGGTFKTPATQQSHQVSRPHGLFAAGSRLSSRRQ